MEPVTRRFKGPSLYKLANAHALAEVAKAHVAKHCQADFDAAWKRVEERSKRPVTEEEFTREYLWCVYVSGLSARGLTSKYGAILDAYGIVAGGHFIPALVHRPPSWERVKPVWGNRAKFKAVSTVREMIAKRGWPTFYATYLAHRDPKDIQGLPFMGPALSFHLARNIGNVEAVKPDRHMVKLAWHYGFGAPRQMCVALATTPSVVSDWPCGKIDMLIWYCAATLAR